MSRLAEIEAKRAERKAKLHEQWEAQRAIDLEAIDSLEVEHGDSNVAIVDVEYTPGMVTLVAARCPSPAEVKRYRARLKPKRSEDRPDTVAAAEELATVCRLYPDAEAYAAVCDARPGVHAQLGAAAVKLALGEEQDRGKE